MKWISEQHDAHLNWQLLSQDRFLEMKLSAEIVFFCFFGKRSIFKFGCHIFIYIILHIYKKMLYYQAPIVF